MQAIQVGDKVTTLHAIDDETGDTGMLLAGSDGVVVSLNAPGIEVEMDEGGIWSMNMDDVKLVTKKLTEAEEFSANFNFCHISGHRIMEIKFMDGSIAKYGTDWLD